MAGRGPGGVAGHLGLAVVLLAFGFLLGTGFVQEGIREREAPSRRQQLEALVERRQLAIDELRTEVASLSARVERHQQRAGRRSRRVRDLFERVARVSRLAGVAAVRGPGVVIELTDSSRIPGSREEAADLRIQDGDLQLVVNALWASGAEAVAVNDHRLVSTSAIRRAGGSILVNYARVTSPFRIAAIGDAVALHDRLSGSEVARRFEVWQDVYGLGFSIERAPDVEAPALPTVPDVRWARAASSAG